MSELIYSIAALSLAGNGYLAIELHFARKRTARAVSLENEATVALRNVTAALIRTLPVASDKLRGDGATEGADRLLELMNELKQGLDEL